MAQISWDTAEWLSLVRGLDVVGYVRIVGCDNFHILGRFRAGPAFAQYEELLAEAYRRWAAEADNWLDALEVIDSLGLRLVGSSGWARHIRDFQLEALEKIGDSDGVPVEFKFIGAEPGAGPIVVEKSSKAWWRFWV